jgi:hypothetical protein
MTAMVLQQTDATGTMDCICAPQQPRPAALLLMKGNHKQPLRLTPEAQLTSMSRTTAGRGSSGANPANRLQGRHLHQHSGPTHTCQQPADPQSTCAVPAGQGVL